MGVASTAAALLLVLDFSGSMQQKIGPETKAQELKTQTRALLSTLRPDETVQTVIFGAKPQNACQDIVTRTGRPATGQKWVQDTSPGAFGKTPLARVLWQMRDWSRRLKRNTAVIITDGADTCHQDACVALADLEKALAKDRRHLDLILLGYDLQSESGRFECFKKMHTRYLNVQFFSAQNAWDLQKALNESLAREQQAVQKSDREARLGLNDPRSASANVDTEKEKGDAGIRVDGAEAKDHFVIYQNGRIARDWFGGLPTQLPPGSYRIKYDDPNGKTLDVPLVSRQQRVFVLEDFMVKTAGDPVLREASLGIELTPDARTSLVHRNLKPLLFHASFDPRGLVMPQVPLGSWTMRIVSPPWLKGRTPDQILTVKTIQAPVELSPDLRRELVWVTNDHPETQRVIKFAMTGGRVETQLIAPGITRFPVHASDEWHWLR